MLKTLKCLFALALLSALFHIPSAFGNESQEDELRSFLTNLFEARSSFLADDKGAHIEPFYDSGISSSLHAYHVELNRKQYLQAWGHARGIHITDAKSSIRINRLKLTGDTAVVSLAHSQQLNYMYTSRILLPQSFGIGTWHAITLTKRGGNWKVLKEWYLDPLEENPRLIAKLNGDYTQFPDTHNQTGSGNRYNRQKAVAYANKYAGAAWGAGNNGRYNPKYVNYNVKGGDCTNFASQVLGDPEEGGGLRMTGPWRYRYAAGGSKTWVQTDSFKNFLIRSGYGKIIATGYFADVSLPSGSFPKGAFAELMPGDLIAHVIRNDVDHFSVVTGFDDNGYPLVNSHTADRFRAPFDLGWDKYTKYILIHIND